MIARPSASAHEHCFNNRLHQHPTRHRHAYRRVARIHRPPYPIEPDPLPAVLPPCTLQRRHGQQDAGRCGCIGIRNEVCGQGFLDPARRPTRLVRPTFEQDVGPILRPDLLVDCEGAAARHGKKPVNAASLSPAVMLNGHRRHQCRESPPVDRDPPVRPIFGREREAFLEAVDTTAGAAPTIMSKRR